MITLLTLTVFLFVQCIAVWITFALAILSKEERDRQAREDRAKLPLLPLEWEHRDKEVLWEAGDLL